MQMRTMHPSQFSGCQMSHSIPYHHAALFLPEKIYQETNDYETKVTKPNAFTSQTLVPGSVWLSFETNTHILLSIWQLQQTW